MKKMIKDVVQLMYDTALLSSGYSHDDPSTFTKRIYRMIGLGMDIDEPPEEEVTVENTEVSVEEVKEDDVDMEQLDQAFGLESPFNSTQINNKYTNIVTTTCIQDKVTHSPLMIQ